MRDWRKYGFENIVGACEGEELTLLKLHFMMHQVHCPDTILKVCANRNISSSTKTECACAIVHNMYNNSVPTGIYHHQP